MGEIDDLFALLKGSAFAPFNPAAGDPNQIPQQGVIGDGNVQPSSWYSEHGYSSSTGLTNLFDDAPMDTAANASGFPTGHANRGQVSQDWYGHCEVASGSNFAGNFWTFLGRTDPQNEANSQQLIFHVGELPGAVDLEDILNGPGAYGRSLGGTIQLLPFMVGAMRVASPTGTLINVTTMTLSLEMWNAYHNLAFAQLIASTSLDLLAMTPGSIQQLVVSASMAAVEAASYGVFDSVGLVVRLHVVTSNSGAHFGVNIAEPQFHGALIPDPLPFLPNLGHWVPTRLFSQWNWQLTDVVASTRFITEYNDRFRLLASGNLLWGDGYSPATARLARTADKTVTLDDGAGGAATFIVASRVATPKTTQTVVAGTAIAGGYEVVQIDSSGDVTMTAAPTVADGANGQMLTIINVDSTDTITLQDQGTLAGSNLRLAAATVALAPRQSIQFMYSSTVGDWVQIGNKVAVL